MGSILAASYRTAELAAGPGAESFAPWGQTMLKAIKALTEKGETPPGVDPAHQRVRSAAVILPHDQPFTDGAREALLVREGVAHATV